MSILTNSPATTDCSILHVLLKSTLQQQNCATVVNASKGQPTSGKDWPTNEWNRKKTEKITTHYKLIHQLIAAGTLERLQSMGGQVAGSFICQLNFSDNVSWLAISHIRLFQSSFFLTRQPNCTMQKGSLTFSPWEDEVLKLPSMDS